MTKEELEKQMLSVLNQIAVANLFEEELVKKLGRSGYEQRIDSLLDQYLEWRRRLEEIKKTLP